MHIYVHIDNVYICIYIYISAELSSPSSVWYDRQIVPSFSFPVCLLSGHCLRTPRPMNLPKPITIYETSSWEHYLPLWARTNCSWLL